MHDLVFYTVEFVVILVGIVLVHKFVFNHKRIYDLGSLYLSILAASYLWVVTACMQLFGFELGIVGGLIVGAMAVFFLDSATGFLHNAGY